MKMNFKLPYELKKEIENSKKILDLNDGWNGKDSRGYKKKTWKTAIKFLVNLIEIYYDKYNQYLDVPYIDTGNNGDIDLHWKTEKYELHLTIPENSKEPISFYGDNYGNNVSEGIFTKDIVDSLLSWIKNSNMIVFNE